MADQSNTRPRRRDGADEADAYSPVWRRWLFWRAGERKDIKRRSHKHERQQVKREIRERAT